MMRGSGGGDLGGRGVGGDASYNTQIHASIDHGGGHCLTATMSLTPGTKAYNNQQTNYATGLCH
jgi:hypothetical protein